MPLTGMVPASIRFEAMVSEGRDRRPDNIRVQGPLATCVLRLIIIVLV